MANSLATRVKEQARLAVEKSYYTELLLESSQKLQQSQTELDCLRMTAEQLSRLFDRPVLYALSRGDAELSFRAEPPEASPLLSQLGLEELGVAKGAEKQPARWGNHPHTARLQMAVPLRAGNPGRDGHRRSPHRRVPDPGRL